MSIIGEKGSSTRIATHLNQHNLDFQNSLARISSGKAILRAADSPASFIKAERLDSDVAALDQAIRNTETDISILQIADDGLASIGEALKYLNQTVLKAANFNNWESVSRDTYEFEIQSSLETIDRIAKETKFGQKRLLDGSSGTTGVALNDEIILVSANENTLATPPAGLPIEITQRATQSYLLAKDVLSEEDLVPGTVFRALKDGRVAHYTVSSSDTVSAVINNFQLAIDSAGLDLTVDLSPNNRLLLYNNQFGSRYSFKASSSVDDLLSDEADVWQDAIAGVDAEGTVNGQALIGEGQLLRAGSKSELAGLVLRYNYDQPNLENSSPAANNTGILHIKQNALYFQNYPAVGGGFFLSLGDNRASNLGRAAVNDSNFTSLKDLNVSNPKAVQSSLAVIKAAQDEILNNRARIGAAQKHSLETSLYHLLNMKENVSAAASTIRDLDYASEISKMVQSQLSAEAASWSLNRSAQLQQELTRSLLDNNNDWRTG